MPATFRPPGSDAPLAKKERKKDYALKRGVNIMHCPSGNLP